MVAAPEGGDGDLPQAQSTVVGRHEPVAINAKALLAEPLEDLFRQQGVEKHPAAEYHLTHAASAPDPSTDAGDQRGNGRVEATGDPPPVNLPGHFREDLADRRTEIGDPGGASGTIAGPFHEFHRV